MLVHNHYHFTQLNLNTLYQNTSSLSYLWPNHIPVDGTCGCLCSSHIYMYQPPILPVLLPMPQHGDAHSHYGQNSWWQSTPEWHTSKTLRMMSWSFHDDQLYIHKSPAVNSKLFSTFFGSLESTLFGSQASTFSRGSTSCRVCLKRARWNHASYH